MNKTTKYVMAGAVVVATLVGGVGVAVANSQDDGGTSGADGNRPVVTAEEREQAEAAAIAHAGGGRVTESEIDDDGGPSRYEIEVTLDDGNQIDVDLDESFRVIGEEREGPEADDRWDD